jgi:glycosyltransferase involved in cell wall biosynthesis
MESPIVSILSPTYNHEKFIAHCIRSVQGQTFNSWEMIILDDGSTDSTMRIAEEFARNDKRIQTLTQVNVGVFRLAETYNKGLQIAKGKYIAILEGDDVWVSDKLERQVEILEKDPGVILAWGQSELINEDGTEIYYISPKTDNIPAKYFNNTPPGSIIELALFNAWLPALTLLIRKDVLSGIGGFLQSHGMPLVDFPTILTLSLQGKFYFENRVLGSWRIYATQTTKKHTVEIYRGMKEFLESHLISVFPDNPQAINRIIDYYRKLCLIAYARSGRYKLIRKEFKSARTDYLKAITYPVNGKMIWRLRAAVGYGLSLFHLDVEWLARLIGKQTYKPAK